ncbi:MAG: bifunctional DNA primase/polymerase [Chloroflexota bacterium]
MSVYQQAMSYRNSGISIIPLSYGTQIPAGKLLPQVPNLNAPGSTKGTFSPYREAIATQKEIHTWFAQHNQQLNVGVVLGLVSNGLFVLDFDMEARESIVKWKGLIGDSLFERMPIVKTNKGFHVYLRAGEMVKNQVLARREDNGKNEILIEVKGRGGLCTAPPSKHPAGSFYKWVQLDHTQIPFLSSIEYHTVMGAAAMLNRKAIKPVEIPLYIEPKQADSQLTPARLERVKAYAAGIIRNISGSLEGAGKGERNHQLNRVAFIAGRYIGAGLVLKTDVMETLKNACLSNGLMVDDGPNSFISTAEGAILAGMRSPVEISELIQKMERQT